MPPCQIEDPSLKRVMRSFDPVEGGNHKRDKKFDEGESFGFHNVVCILDFDVVDRGMKFSTQLADDCRSY